MRAFLPVPGAVGSGYLRAGSDTEIPDIRRSEMVVLTLQVKCLSLGTSRSTKCFIHLVRGDSGSFRIRAILHGALPHISNLKLVFELFKRVDGLDVKEIRDETGLQRRKKG